MPAKDYEQWKKDGNRDSESLRYTFTATFKSGDAELTGFAIQLKKGSSITLDALISGDTKDTVKWSSSDKTVATVTKKGKITAKKAGTAVITAKLGKSSIEITVKVTK